MRSSIQVDTENRLSREKFNRREGYRKSCFSSTGEIPLIQMRTALKNVQGLERGCGQEGQKGLPIGLRHLCKLPTAAQNKKASLLNQ